MDIVERICSAEQNGAVCHRREGGPLVLTERLQRFQHAPQAAGFEALLLHGAPGIEVGGKGGCFQSHHGFFHGGLGLSHGALHASHRQRHGGFGNEADAVITALVEVVEKGGQGEELALAERVILVVMTARAACGEAHPGGGRGLNAVEHILDAVFLINGAGLGIEAVVAVEAGGQDLLDAGLRQKVAGELQDRELVKGQVAVECLHHPVPPAPHAAQVVLLVAVRIGIAREVQPVPGHALAVMGTAQEFLDEVRQVRQV